MIAGILVFVVVFARDVLLGGHLGFSSDLDVFFILLVIPTVIETAIAAAAAASLLPLLGISHRRHRDSGRVLWQVVTGLGILLFALSLPFLVIPGTTARILSLDCGPADRFTIMSAVRMTGALLPLAGLAAILSTALASSGKKRVPILGRILPAFAVAAAVLAVDLPDLTVLVTALMAGTLCRFALLFGTLVRTGIPLKRPRPRWKGARALVLFIGVPLVVFILRNLHLVTERVLGMHHQAVSVVGLVLAFLPLTPVLGLIGSVTSILLLPFIMRSGLSGQKDEIARLMSLGIQLTLALAIPASFSLWVFRQEVVTVLFGWGTLSADDLGNLGSLLGWYAWGIGAFAVLPVLLRIMQITRSIRFQMATGAGAFILTFGLQWGLLYRYGYHGIPAGTVIGAAGTVLFLVLMLSRDLGRESIRNVPFFTIALLTASLCSVWTAEKLFQWLAEKVELLWLPLALSGAFFMLAFSLILLMFTWRRILDAMSDLSRRQEMPE